MPFGMFRIPGLDKYGLGRESKLLECISNERRGQILKVHPPQLNSEQLSFEGTGLLSCVGLLAFGTLGEMW